MVHLIKRGEKWSARVGITGVKWEMGKPTVPPAPVRTEKRKKKGNIIERRKKVVTMKKKFERDEKKFPNFFDF